jgi:hypothetical protein
MRAYAFSSRHTARTDPCFGQGPLSTEVAWQQSENDRASVLTRSVRLRGGVRGLLLRQQERMSGARQRQGEVESRLERSTEY